MGQTCAVPRGGAEPPKEAQHAAQDGGAEAQQPLHGDARSLAEQWAVWADDMRVDVTPHASTRAPTPATRAPVDAAADAAAPSDSAQVGDVESYLRNPERQRVLERARAELARQQSQGVGAAMSLGERTRAWSAEWAEQARSGGGVAAESHKKLRPVGVHVLGGHTSVTSVARVRGIQCMRYHAGFVVSGSRDHTVAVHSLMTGESHCVLRRHTREVVGVEIFSTTEIISIGRDGLLCVWRGQWMQRQKEDDRGDLSPTRTASGACECVREVAVPDAACGAAGPATQYWVGSASGQLYVVQRDMRTGDWDRVATYAIDDKAPGVTVLAFVPRGFFVAGLADGTLCSVLPSGEVGWRVPMPVPGIPSALAVTASMRLVCGTRYASSAARLAEPRVFVFALDGRVLSAFRYASEDQLWCSVHAVAVLGERVVVALENQQVQVWALSGDILCENLWLAHGGEPHDDALVSSALSLLVVQPASHALLCGAKDGRIACFDFFERPAAPLP